MLRTILELFSPPQFRLALALARMSAVAAAIVSLACGMLKAPSEQSTAFDDSQIAVAEIFGDLPFESEGDSESERDAEPGVDTQWLFYSGFTPDQHRCFIDVSLCSSNAFLPLRSREIERELFRPPRV